MAPTRATRTTREDGSRSGQRRDRASLQGHRRARVRATAGQSGTDSAANSSAVTVLVHFRSIAQRLVNERFHTSIVATCRRTRAGPVPHPAHAHAGASARARTVTRTWVSCTMASPSSSNLDETHGVSD